MRRKSENGQASKKTRRLTLTRLYRGGEPPPGEIRPPRGPAPYITVGAKPTGQVSGKQ